MLFALDQRIIKPPHHAESLGALAADDDAVRVHAVLDGGALLEELGVGDDLDVRLGLLAEEVIKPAVGAGGDGGLDDDRHHVLVLELRQRVADLLAGALEVAHVHGAVRLGRGADAEEDDLSLADGGADVVGELELARRVVLVHQLLQAGLEDRAMAVLKRLELSLVLLDPADGVTDRRQARAGNQAHITAADDRHIHRAILTLTFALKAPLQPPRPEQGCGTGVIIGAVGICRQPAKPRTAVV
jgi:hypothetical protein